MDTIFVLIIFLISCLLIFNTPHIIINIMCRFNGRTKLTYVFNYSDSNSTIQTVTYSFDHGFYDGSLMKQYIEHSVSIPTRSVSSKISFYEPFQVINSSDSAKEYSSFTRSIGHILERRKRYETKTKIRVGVLMSKRYALNNEMAYGNYFRFPHYDVNLTDAYDVICEKHHRAIEAERNKKDSYFKLCDLYSIAKNDIIFVSNRDTSQIKRKDGNVLTLLRKKKFHSEQHMYECIFQKANIKFVFMDYLDGNWIISDYVSH